MGNWLDRNILSEIPGYTFLMEMGANIAGLESDETRVPVSISFGAFSQLGFLIEKINEELGFGVAFEGAGSQELKSLIESEKMKLGEAHYMVCQTKKSTWMAVAETII